MGRIARKTTQPMADDVTVNDRPVIRQATILIAPTNKNCWQEINSGSAPAFMYLSEYNRCNAYVKAEISVSASPVFICLSPPVKTQSPAKETTEATHSHIVGLRLKSVIRKIGTKTTNSPVINPEFDAVV